MSRVFALILLTCISEARLPKPTVLESLTERVRQEAFGKLPLEDGWIRAWSVTCAALGGIAEPLGCYPESLPYMYLACRTPEDAEETRPLSRIHASALSPFVVWQNHATMGDEIVILDSRGRVQAAAKLASSSAQR